MRNVKVIPNLSPRQRLRVEALHAALESRAPAETTAIVLSRAAEIYDWLIEEGAKAPSRAAIQGRP